MTTLSTAKLHLALLSVCLVLWASLPEIKTDDDDDDDDDELRVRTGRTELAARCDGFGELSERTESDVVLGSDLELVLRAGAQRDHLVPPAPPCQHTHTHEHQLDIANGPARRNRAVDTA